MPGKSSKFKVQSSKPSAVLRGEAVEVSVGLAVGIGMFCEAAVHGDVGGDARAMLVGVLVDGLSMAEACRRSGMSYESGRRMVGRFKRRLAGACATMGVEREEMMAGGGGGS